MTLYLYSSDLQFGFKQRVGCNSAIYTVRSVIEYYTKHGSTVNICLLDMSKAFDKVNHFGLYLKLMKRNIPPKFLLVLMNWYSKCSALVRWNGVFSSAFNIPCGVRQGGVLSPVLFNIYVNDIIANLSSSQLGCSICNMYVGCVMYADDLLLMSASLTKLQKMIDICVAEACYLDMKFNATKSVVMRIGQCFSTRLQQRYLRWQKSFVCR